MTSHTEAATQQSNEQKLESVYSSVSEAYQGTGADIYALCREMRQNSPVWEGDFIGKFGVPTNAGMKMKTRKTVAVFKYQDVLNVLKDPTNYTNGFIAEGLGAVFDGLIILAMDGQQHRNVRAMLQPAFMPETVNKWKPALDRIMREEFIAPLVANKKADLAGFGLNFPIRAIYAVMGFPEDKETYRQYATWGLAILGANIIDPTKIDEARRQAGIALKGLYDSIKGVVQQRRAEGATGDDLISRLIRAEYEGRRLDDHEVTTFVRSLLPAATETTTRTFSAVMTMLLTKPELMARLMADRSLLNKIIDETVRFEPVSTFKVREAAKDMEIGGVKIEKGSFVQCMVASANRDETVFENPDVFDVDRRQKPSFGFGFGAHMCIGQFVAKVEIVCAVNAVLDLLPNLRVDPTQAPPVIEGAMLRGAKNIHVIWD
ncbi:cytochrome P450 [Paucibacter sp. R3-3]|uniref:Cytochrome P450 n=1 Tax=Roseateles agri TaxID=3098619 RepID=A0ABU5DR30_9BURK|nr:cytochrome P450 [Paucibacter sp. R3-3]MDY0748171.1 cytochrome P450 [Paucibacter sp. R3-3]